MFNPRDSQAKTQNSFGGFHRGIVVNNVDDLKSGRIQVRVIPFFDGVKDGDLPWAIYADAFMGGLSNNGSIMVPEKDSHVFVFFENMDFRFPVYFAAAPAIQNGVPDAPKLSRADDGTVVAINAAKKTNIPTSSGISWDEPDSAYDAEYPHNKVMRTQSGIVVEFDDTPAKERIHVYHPSGSRTEINAVGDSVAHVVGDDYKIVIGDGKMYVEGDLDISVGGNANVSAAVINLGESGNLEPMVLGDKLATWITSTLKSWLNSHTHTISTGSSAGSTTTPIVTFDEGDGASAGNVYSSKNKTQ